MRRTKGEPGRKRGKVREVKTQRKRYGASVMPESKGTHREREGEQVKPEKQKRERKKVREGALRMIVCFLY